MTFEEYYGDYYPLLQKAEADLLELIGNYSSNDWMRGSDENAAAHSVEHTDRNAEEDTQPIIYVKSRIKSPESMAEKLKRSGLATDADTAMENMHDAVGIRVICSFIDNVYQVADWIGQQEGYEVVDRKDYIAYPKPNGYRSLHLILRVGKRESGLEPDGKNQTDESISGPDGKNQTDESAPKLDGQKALLKEHSDTEFGTDGLLVEIQLRTIAIDFWAALEHQIKYKHSISNERMIREELKRCADEIASVDMSMQTIRDAIRRA